MERERIEHFKKIYHNTLLNDVIPFWMKHSPDFEHGGYYHCLDRDGSILSTDKAVWIQAREVWTFSRLYNTVEKKREWLDMARLGYEFLMRFCFDIDGRMFFLTTCDGKPLRKRRYWFAETFATIACAEYARASGNEEAMETARKTYHLILQLYKDNGLTSPKVFPETRQTKSHAESMILISTSQIMREIDKNPLYDSVIEMCINEVLGNFLKRDKQVLLETVGPKGEILDNPQGRCINPGHAIETAWFLMSEGLYRKDNSLVTDALQILDWSLERGWDKEFGGLFYFLDIDGKPPEQLEWDMKLWWPHNEALYALLLANYITNDKKYEEWYEKVHKWAFEHFPDEKNGEWFGYLHRDGTVSLQIKGSVWKGPFHLPRQLLNGLLLLNNWE